MFKFFLLRRRMSNPVSDYQRPFKIPILCSEYIHNASNLHLTQHYLIQEIDASCKVFLVSLTMQKRNIQDNNVFNSIQFYMIQPTIYVKRIYYRSSIVHGTRKSSRSVNNELLNIIKFIEYVLSRSKNTSGSKYGLKDYGVVVLSTG